MAIKNIEITLSSGQKYKLRQPDSLKEIDSSRTALFVFDNLACYVGCSDGNVDEDGYFCIEKPGQYPAIGMPFSRLMGWAYKHKREKQS